MMEIIKIILAILLILTAPILNILFWWPLLVYSYNYWMN